MGSTKGIIAKIELDLYILHTKKILHKNFKHSAIILTCTMWLKTLLMGNLIIEQKHEKLIYFIIPEWQEEVKSKKLIYGPWYCIHFNWFQRNLKLLNRNLRQGRLNSIIGPPAKAVHWGRYLYNRSQE